MDEQMQENQEQVYQPRPRWQRWLAWVGVAIMIVSVILYYIQIAKGGL